jgi:hypothetical protein
VAGKQRQHVVKKTDSRPNASFATPIEINFGANPRFVCDAFDLSPPGVHLALFKRIASQRERQYERKGSNASAFYCFSWTIVDSNPPGRSRRQDEFCLRVRDAGLFCGSMQTKLLRLMALTIIFSATASLIAEDVEPGFTSLCDGKSFDGWKTADENKETWTIEDGAFVAHGNRCHLFYVGDKAPFKNFDLKVDVMTGPHSNGGIYFHTKYQANDWPRVGFECQVNNTHSDWIKTGSLYGLVNIANSPAQDGKWWTQEIIVKGNSVTVLVDGKRVFEYNEPPGAQPGKDFMRKLSEGTFALQGHDPGSVVRYKNIRVKKLD